MNKRGLVCISLVFLIGLSLVHAKDDDSGFKPDLAIQSIEFWNPDKENVKPQLGDYVGFKVTVKNIGRVSAKGPMKIKASLNNVQFLVNPEGDLNLGVGQKANYTYMTNFKFTNDSYIYVIRIDLDYTEVIDEIKEGNNFEVTYFEAKRNLLAVEVVKSVTVEDILKKYDVRGFYSINRTVTIDDVSLNELNNTTQGITVRLEVEGNETIYEEPTGLFDRFLVKLSRFFIQLKKELGPPYSL